MAPLSICKRGKVPVFQIWGTSPANLLTAFQPVGGGRTFGQSLLYQNSTAFGILNGDGSSSYFTGAGLVWNSTLKAFTAGMVTSIARYVTGLYNDQVTGLSIAAATVQSAFQSTSGPLDTLLAGNDTIDAPARVGGAVIDTTLNGSAGNDILKGGAGKDVLNGGSGNDQLLGGGGNDSLRGGSGADALNGGSGWDTASYHAEAAIWIDLSALIFSGAAAGDTFTSIEYFTGSNTGDDTLKGAGTNNYFWGNGGNDSLVGNGGNDYLSGGEGADQINGGDGNDRIYDLEAVASIDVITGGSGTDLIVSGAGDDIIDAGTGQDVVKGGLGNDKIWGGPDPDIIVFSGTRAQNTFAYNALDYSIWVLGPDGSDQVFSALTLAFDDGTWRYDVPTVTWIQESNLTGQQWIDTLA